jgi:prepilin-type N-terminal cleavage/methylation domain-containing protein
MSQDGYTLTEMLAALVMIGLAIGGLTEGMRSLGLIQGSTGRVLADDRALRATHQTLDRLVAGQGPFTTGDPRGFVGQADRFSFDCDGSAPCTAALAPAPGGERLSVSGPSGATTAVVLRGLASVRFSYEGTRSVDGVWPPAPTSGPAQPQTLRAITLLGGTAAGEAPITRARIWAEQPSDCAFDIIGQVCRKAPAP